MHKTKSGSQLRQDWLLWVLMVSQAGVQRGRGTLEQLVSRMKHTVKERWRSMEVIVIEECSMLSAQFLHTLSSVAMLLKRKPGVVFGGVTGNYCCVSTRLRQDGASTRCQACRLQEDCQCKHCC